MCINKNNFYYQAFFYFLYKQPVGVLRKIVEYLFYIFYNILFFLICSPHYSIYIHIHIHTITTPKTLRGSDLFLDTRVHRFSHFLLFFHMSELLSCGLFPLVFDL